MKNSSGRGNLFRVMSATIDPAEFLGFMGIKNLYTISGRRYPVSMSLEMAKDNFEMQDKLVSYLYSQPDSESWLVFLPTRRLVEKYAKSYGGVYLHGGLEGAEVNKIPAEGGDRQEPEDFCDKRRRLFSQHLRGQCLDLQRDN